MKPSANKYFVAYVIGTDGRVNFQSRKKGNLGNMKTLKQNLLVLLVGLLISSCVERYIPATELSFKSQLVVDGTITTDGGEQEIRISKSSPTGKPKFLPLSGCYVSVDDGKGNSFTFLESKDLGHYLSKIDNGFFNTGESYRLDVRTPEGHEYVSSSEELMPCPEVDNVYYELETKPTDDPNVNETGLQFFLDFKADESFGRYFRWQLTETWEYHSKWPLDKWLDKDGSHDLIEPDYSNFVCYGSDKLENIFVLSTNGFSQNSYSKYKLHFVQDQTQHLQYKYSLLVNQYSVTEAAYNYWDNLRKNNQESVDLFGKQPANVKGNIHNVNDSTDVALGYFGVSAVQSKRIMVLPIAGLSFDQAQPCRAYVIDGPLPADRPLYFATDFDENFAPYLGVAAADCIFCTLLGGTTVKPPYWDQK